MATIIQDGSAEDLIRSFTQLACTEGHYKTLIEKYNSQLNEGIYDGDPQEIVVKLNDAIDELELIAELRRKVMLQLMERYDGADKDMWCIVKHLSQAAYNAFEAMQAADNDGELLSLYLDINARLVKALTRFLGVEITACSACFGDILRGTAREDEVQDDLLKGEIVDG